MFDNIAAISNTLKRFRNDLKFILFFAIVNDQRLFLIVDVDNYVKTWHDQLTNTNYKMTNGCNYPTMSSIINDFYLYHC